MTFLRAFDRASSRSDLVVFVETRALRALHAGVGLVFAAVCFGALFLAPSRVGYGGAGRAAVALLGAVGLSIVAIALAGAGSIAADRRARRLTLRLGLSKLSRRPRHVPFDEVARLRLLTHPSVSRTKHTLLAELRGGGRIVLDHPFTAEGGRAMGGELAGAIGCALEVDGGRR